MKSEELLEIRLELKGARAAVAGIDDTAKAQVRLTKAILATGKAADATWKKTNRLFGAFLTLEHGITRATVALRRYIALLGNPKLKGTIGGMAAAPKGGGQTTAKEFFGVPFGEAGISGEKMAKEVWNGFWNSDALGKFLITGWFFNALGGGALIKAVGDLVGRRLAIGLVARFLPSLLTEVAAAGTLSEALAPVAVAAFAAVGWEVLAVAAAVAVVAAAFFFAYKKIKWFRDGVNAVVGFIKKHWKALPFLIPIRMMIDAIVHWKTTLKRMLLLALGPIGAVITAFRHWRTIIGIVADVVGFVKDNFNGFIKFLFSLPGRMWGFITSFGSIMINGLKNVGLDAGEAFVNGLIELINEGIESINGILDDANFAADFGFHVPHIGTIGLVGSDRGGSEPPPSVAKQRQHRGVGPQGKPSPTKPHGQSNKTSKSNRLAGVLERPEPNTEGSKLAWSSPRPREERPKIIQLHAHLELNGKQIAESVTRHALAEAALA